MMPIEHASTGPVHDNDLRVLRKSVLPAISQHHPYHATMGEHEMVAGSEPIEELPNPDLHGIGALPSRSLETVERLQRALQVWWDVDPSCTLELSEVELPQPLIKIGIPIRESGSLRSSDEVRRPDTIEDTLLNQRAQAPRLFSSSGCQLEIGETCKPQLSIPLRLSVTYQPDPDAHDAIITNAAMAPNSATC